MKDWEAAEAYVAARLEESGWEVLGRDLRTPWAQLDLLARDPSGVLVAVEVKARHPLSWAQGEEALRPRQRRRLARALTGLAKRRGRRDALRVDLALVTLHGGRPVAWERLAGVELFDEGVQGG